MTVDAQFVSALVVLVALYGAVVYRQLRGRADQIPSLFLGAAVALLAVGALTIDQATLAVDLPIISFLFSMFVFAVALDRAGAISHLAKWLASKAQRPEDLVLYLFMGFGLVSTILVNDALVVLMVPLLLHLARQLHLRPLPLLLTLAYAVTIGSALTPMGNPQNLLVALGSGMADPFLTFVRYLLLPVVASLVVGGFLLRRWLGPQLHEGALPFDRTLLPQVPLVPKGGWSARLLAYPSLTIFPATMLALIVTSIGNALGALPNIPIYAVVGAGAVLLLIVSPARQGIIARVDWSTLLLFVGLFVVMAGEVNAGVVGSLASHFPIAPYTGTAAGPEALGSILASSALGSQLFSNVPWVALSLPTMTHLGYGPSTPVAWIALAAGSTMAGSLTLLGAASNLIIAQQAQKGGVHLRLLDFMRYGVPLALLSMGLTFGCLVFGL